MHKRAALLILILVIALTVGWPEAPRDAFAQNDSTTPIYFLMDGDIWHYTPATGRLEQGSTWGFNEKPVMSPDGTQFAYLSLATVGANFVRNGGALFDPRPVNIWIWELDINDANRLVDQPANASVSNTGAQNVIRRSSLSWSPAGGQLAWIELDSNFDFRLAIHDFNVNASRFVPAQLPIPYGDGGFIGEQKLAWGPGGIAVENFSVASNPGPGQSGPFFESAVFIFDPVSGNLASSYVVSSNNDQLIHFYWIDAQNIALFFYSGNIGALNLATGKVMPTNISELYSLQAPGSGGISVQVGSAVAQNSLRRNWTIMPSGFTFQTNDLRDRVALSPSGTQVAYLDDALYIWSNGQVARIAGTEGVADEVLGGLTWGATGWRPSGTPGATVSNCTNVPAPRLVVGASGAVIPGLGDNVLRDRPGRSAVGSVEIGKIPPNGVFTVLAGPECASGLNWWQVNYNGQVGWTAEGEGNTYWVEPR